MAITTKWVLENSMMQSAVLDGYFLAVVLFITSTTHNKKLLFEYRYKKRREGLAISLPSSYSAP
jgi:hypothetical protein